MITTKPSGQSPRTEAPRSQGATGAAPSARTQAPGAPARRIDTKKIAQLENAKRFNARELEQLQRQIEANQKALNDRKDQLSQAHEQLIASLGVDGRFEGRSEAYRKARGNSSSAEDTLFKTRHLIAKRRANIARYDAEIARLRG